MARPRRISSGLGADIRGDTSAPAISTLNTQSPPTSPIEASLSPPTSPSKPPRRRPLSRQRRKARSLLERWKLYSLKHTWINPLIVVLGILTGYAFNPTPSNPLHKAIFLSYPVGKNKSTGATIYGKGRHDLAFVAFYTVVLSFTREFIMQRVIRPLATLAGIKRRSKQARFMEQVYTALYFGISGPLGLYVMHGTPIWYFNTKAFYEGFPHRTHEGMFKAYYLLQAAYWAQQAIVLVLQLEKPRKDFKELVAHHIITLSLIGLSYRFHFTHMGLAVYITHDISDFFLATSKTLNYLDSPIVGPYFGTFVAAWIYMRHFLNLKVLWSILTEFATVGPFDLNWETQQYKCLLSQVITFSLLASLQAVNIFWLYLILRIAKNYIFSNPLADDRSDDEADEDEEVPSEKPDIKVLVNGKPLEGEANRHVHENGLGLANGNGVHKKNQ